MKIDFYNFQKRSFEDGFINLVKKSYETQKRIIIKVKNKDQKEKIDKLLWEYDDESWLPHADVYQEKQLIIITEEITLINKPSIIIIIDTSDIPNSYTDFERCLYIFNGNNQEELQKARAQYKLFLEKKAELQYHNL